MLSEEVCRSFENCEASTAACSPIKPQRPKKNIRNIATACTSLNLDFNQDDDDDEDEEIIPAAPKKVEKPAKVYVYTEQDLIDLPVKCDHCDRRFKKPESLGGHVSKAHPGKSLIYAKKIQRRNEREPDRLLLAKAKQILLK